MTIRTRGLVILLVVVVGCGGDSGETGGADDLTGVATRVDAIAEQVDTWRNAGSYGEAATAAETAANLIVGSNGPGFGDRNRDGVIGGDVDDGLLPGRDGTPAGVILGELGSVACLERDVLGGPWDDPATRWGQMETAIAEWAPTNNTMPSLASHPMRVVGWATFTLESGDLDKAHEYAGHALLHVDVTESSLAAC
jgi:hypothetical protein